MLRYEEELPQQALTSHKPLAIGTKVPQDTSDFGYASLKSVMHQMTASA